MNSLEKANLGQRIGFLILGFDLLLFVLLIALSALRMMDGGEFNESLGLLVPLRGLYTGNIVKYLIADNSLKVTDRVKSRFYGTIVTLVISLHFISVIGVIFIFGLGGNTDLFWLRNGIAMIETFFGVYLSQVIPDLFSISKAN